MRPGDTFVSVNGDRTETFPDFQKAITKVGDNADGQPGEVVTVPAVVSRDGKDVNLDLQVELVERLATSGNTMVVGAVGVQSEVPQTCLLYTSPSPRD